LPATLRKFASPLRLLSLACVGAAALLIATQGVAETLEAAFAAPPLDARPRVRWWWPGDAVTDAELRREIELMDAVGFGGAEIQAFKPGIPNLTPEERAVIDGYATPRFFAHVKAAADAAQAHGLSLDYTFGSGWPSGGGLAVPPERALLELTMSRTEVTGGAGPIKLQMPARTKRFGVFGGLAGGSTPATADWPARFEARAKVVAVIAVKGSAPSLQPPKPSQGLELYPWRDVIAPGRLQMASALVLTDRLRADGTLDWRPPPGTWQVFVFKQYASNTGVSGPAGAGPQLVLDHMDKAAFEAHAARVGDAMTAALGPSIAGLRATFVDSLELMQDLPWTADFLAQFRARRGYDLTPYLPLVLQPGWMQTWGAHWSAPYFDADGSLAERIRADYRRTVSDLLFEDFVTPFVDWNHDHGLKAKFQAHGAPLDILKGYGVADIPETEDLGGADPHFMRFARSAADIYGRKLISSESLAWSNRPYSVTPDELRRRADVNFASGVNSLIYHGFDYRFHAEAWPGWHAFQPSPFSLGFSTMLTETNPIWAAVPRLNAYVARTQAVLQQGRSLVPIAYFYGDIGYYPGSEDQGAGRNDVQKALLAGGYDYDRINPDGLAGARVQAKRLVTRGGAAYGALVLPRLAALDADTAETIARFAREGLPVLFIDAPPDRDVGFRDRAARDGRVRRAVAQALRAGSQTTPQALLVETLRRRGVAANLRFTGADPSGLVFVQRQAGDRTVTFIHNAAEASRDATLVLPGRDGVSRWDAMNGGRETLATHSGPHGVEVPLELAPGESALLVQAPGTPTGPLPGVTTTLATTLPQAGWSLSVRGHGPSGAVVERDLGQVALGDWRTIPELAAFSGQGEYQRRFEAPASWLTPGARVVMDLGEVHDMATVSLNGHALPAAITAPFRVDVTSLLKPGENRLAITVANTPNNALIDAKAAGFRDLAPVAAGLVGPVAVYLQRSDRTAGSH